VKKISKIKISDKINEEQLNQAMNIFYSAFKQKIRHLIKSREKAVAVYKNSINKDRVFYALIENDVVGIAGLHYENKNFIDIKYSNLRKHFNPLRSFFIYWIYKIVSPKVKEDAVRIDSIAEKEQFRSAGIGTELINKVLEFAKNKAFKEVILEVVNTNPKAKKLYERMGFKEKKHVRYYLLTRPAGFSSEYIMSYAVPHNHS